MVSAGCGQCPPASRELEHVGAWRALPDPGPLSRSCQSMTSLASNTLSPTKDGTSSLPRRQSSFARPPLRALYDLLIAPMEGVSAPWGRAARLLSVGASFPRIPAFSAQLLCQPLKAGYFRVGRSSRAQTLALLLTSLAAQPGSQVQNECSLPCVLRHGSSGHTPAVACRNHGSRHHGGPAPTAVALCTLLGCFLMAPPLIEGLARATSSQVCVFW